MAFRDPDPDYEFEAKVEVTTAKARLVQPTMGPEEAWLPKSQTISMGEPDADGNIKFIVTGWWAKKNGFE